MSNDQNNRDTMILRKIITYCQQLEGTREMFGNSQEAFANSYIFQNACGMCVIQIGELAGKLSAGIQGEICQIPWPLIRGMRNAFAHDYAAMDIKRTWKTLTDDIPALQAACQKYLDK